MDENELNELLVKLNAGAAIVDAAVKDKDKLPGAQIVSEVGAVLVHERREANCAEPLATKTWSSCTSKKFDDLAQKRSFSTE